MIMMPYADAGHRCRAGKRHSSGTPQGIQLLDVQTLQSVLDIVGDGRPVGVRHDLDGVGFGRFTQVRPGSEQLIEHGGFLRRGQGVKR